MSWIRSYHQCFPNVDTSTLLSTLNCSIQPNMLLYSYVFCGYLISGKSFVIFLSCQESCRLRSHRFSLARYRLWLLFLSFHTMFTYQITRSARKSISISMFYCHYYYCFTFTFVSTVFSKCDKPFLDSSDSFKYFLQLLWCRFELLFNFR